MAHEIHVDNLSKKLDESLTVKHNIFGDIVVKYRVAPVNMNTYYLIYSFGGLVDSKGIEIRYDVNMLELQETVGSVSDLNVYFKNCLDFIYSQIKFLNTPEGKKLEAELEDPEKSLILYFKEKVDNKYVQDFQKIV